MASPNGAKQMSSRLATMKFMQRAAARAPEPSTPNGPPSKRQRLSTGTSTPGTPSDYEVVQAAIAAEELKRTQALEKQAAAAGETKWYLSFREPEAGVAKAPPMKVVHAGFSVIDADDSDDSDEGPAIGRMRFGKVKKTEQQNAAESGSDSDESEESDEYDSDDPTAALIRETRRAQAREARKEKKEAREAESKRLAEARRNKNREVNLNKISSISGGGGGGSKSSASPMKCFNCNQTGHKAMDCPQKRGGGQQNGQGKRKR